MSAARKGCSSNLFLYYFFSFAQNNVMISTVILKNKPSIIATSTVAGPKEGESRLGKHIDKIFYDDTMGEKTYEKAECKMLTFVIKNVMENARLKESDVGAIL